MNIVTIIKYFLLGAIQGFTEPLPISSSAHMIIASHWLKLDRVDLDFEIYIHFASFLAIFIFFIPDIISLCQNFKNEKKYVLHLIIASIPAGILGFLLKEWIDQNFVNLKTASILLLITSILLTLTSLMLKKTKKQELAIMSSFIIGLWQALALLPGISRSGATLFGGVSQKINLRAVLKFSFFLYLIASFGALLVSLIDYTPQNINWSNLIITFFSAFLATSIAIRWLFNIISKRSLQIFAVYTFLLGVIVIINL